MALLTGILTGGSNNHQTTSEEANGVYTDFISQGVVGTITNTAGVAPATGGLSVNAQGSPDMTVAVSSGVAYVTGTPTSQSSQTFRVKNTASANVTISANSSGSTKYDWVYVKLDATKLNTPNTAGDDVATLVTSRSSSISSDDGTPPTYGYAIAVVTVANGASSITNGNITDKRASTGASVVIADGSVTNAKLDTTAGAPGGAWASWTPTLTNLSGGTINYAKYMVIGKTMFFKFKYTLGGAGVSGRITFSTPVTIATLTAGEMVSGIATFDDVSIPDKKIGIVEYASTTSLRLSASTSDQTYTGISASGTSSTIPITFATGDIITVNGSCEIA